MEGFEQKDLTALGKDPEIDELIQKLIVGTEMTYVEKIRILQTAILLLVNYNSDNRFRGCREFAYYIFLKYAVTYHDYNPLFDYAINNGLYPIATILQNDTTQNLSLLSELTVSCARVLHTDENNNILTDEQKYFSEEIMQLIQDEDSEVAYIAPTSYGKSSLIVKIIKKKNVNRIGIIVPTKSLLNQTYKMIKKENLEYKLLLHDEMLGNEHKYIAIFTQERALRFFDKHSQYFDLLFIDEAHNLLENDQRSVLLSRVIKINKQNNPSSQNIYLTPLIGDVQNITSNIINERRIQYSMKEPEYIEYLRDGVARVYNRFFNKFYTLERNYRGYIEYITINSRNSNFIFLASPKKIEQFAMEFSTELPDINDTQINDIIVTLSEYVSPNFQMINIVKKGCIYLHGKLPDEIKEYLEHKFQKISLLKYVIANSVVLEGVNLPVETIFIMNRYRQNKQSIVNLIGRVNRLNNIFKKNEEPHTCIEKLIPKIHFINSEYDRANGKMKTTIEKLRSSTFEDKVQNPMLKNTPDLTLEESKIVEIENIAVNLTDDSLKARLIHHNINSFYHNFDSKVDLIQQQITLIKSILILNPIDPIDMIAKVFIEGVVLPQDTGNKDDFEFLRIGNEKARNYYKNYFLINRHLPFAQRVQSQVKYFKIQRNRGNNEFYIGTSFGEIPKSSPNYPSKLKVYVDLNNKDDIYLTNISVIKLKIEQDFISYKLSRCFSFMHEYELLTDEEYNFLMYGTHKIGRAHV